MRDALCGVRTLGLGPIRPAPPLTGQRAGDKPLNSLHQTPPGNWSWGYWKSEATCGKLLCGLERACSAGPPVTLSSTARLCYVDSPLVSHPYQEASHWISFGLSLFLNQSSMVQGQWGGKRRVKAPRLHPQGRHYGCRSNGIRNVAHFMTYSRHSIQYHCVIVFCKVCKEEPMIFPYAYYFADPGLRSTEETEV